MNDTLSAILGTGGAAALIGALTVWWRTRRTTNASIEERAQQAFERLFEGAQGRVDEMAVRIVELERELTHARGQVTLLEGRLEGLLRKLSRLEGERDEALARLQAVYEQIGGGVLSALDRRPAPPRSDETGQHTLDQTQPEPRPWPWPEGDPP